MSKNIENTASGFIAEQKERLKGMPDRVCHLMAFAFDLNIANMCEEVLGTSTFSIEDLKSPIECVQRAYELAELKLGGEASA